MYRGIASGIHEKSISVFSKNHCLSIIIHKPGNSEERITFAGDAKLVYKAQEQITVILTRYDSAKYSVRSSSHTPKIMILEKTIY